MLISYSFILFKGHVFDNSFKNYQTLKSVYYKRIIGLF